MTYLPSSQIIATFRTRKGAENLAAKHGEVTWDHWNGRENDSRWTTYLAVDERFDRTLGRNVYDVQSVHLRIDLEVVNGVVVYEDPARLAARLSA